ncbi:MAG: hypothetical protein V4726_11120 [Verrucomicrobiota bacterium]
MRDYRLKSPGQPGGLVPLNDGPPPANVVPFPITAAKPPVPTAPVPAGGVAVRSFAPGLPSSLAAAVPPSPSCPPRPSVQLPPGTAHQTLSKKEITVLGIIAAKAWRAYLQSDPTWLPDMLAAGHKKGQLEKDWRHGQCRAATATHAAGTVTGISSARRAHWNTLAAHFCALAGEDLASFAATMRDGKAAHRAGADGDSQEDIRQARAVVERTMRDSGFGPAYVAKVISGKYGAASLEQLTRPQLWQLVFTLRNRATARDGGGSAETRNKKQARTVKPTAPF